MQPNDSVLSARVRGEIKEQIEREKNALVGDPTERKAGYIQGLEAAIKILDGGIAAVDDRRPPSPPGAPPIGR